MYLNVNSKDSSPCVEIILQCLEPKCWAQSQVAGATIVFIVEGMVHRVWGKIKFQTSSMEIKLKVMVEYQHVKAASRHTICSK